MAREQPDIRCSVIIPTAGRAPTLARCLAHLAQADEPSSAWEALVMDNGIDIDKVATRRKVEEFEGRIANLRYFSLPAEGMMLGRHRGVQEARGRIVAFLDDDSFVQASWLRGIEEAFRKPSVAMAGGPIIPTYEVDPPGWLDDFWQSNRHGRYCVDLSLLDFGAEAFEFPPPWVWGCNLVIRKNVFLKAGGTHPDCIPSNLQRFQGDGETALATRVEAAGLTALYDPRIAVHHFVPSSRMSSAYFRRRAFYQGVCDSFAQIRRDNGLGPAEGVPPIPKPRGRVSLPGVAGIGRRALGAARRALRLLSPATRDTYRMSRIVRREAEIGYRRGYDFHQYEVHEDPTLLEWVLRKNFLDAGGIPHPGE